MTDLLKVAVVRLWPATEAQLDQGLVGFMQVLLTCGLVLDGLALRVTREGRLTLAFPARRDRNGTRHYYVRPETEAARREIERQVFAGLGVDPYDPKACRRIAPRPGRGRPGW